MAPEILPEKSVVGFLKKQIVLSTIEEVCGFVRNLVRDLASPPAPDPPSGGGGGDAAESVGPLETTLEER
jgi:hypothetical protein